MGRMMYERDEILIENLKKERLQQIEAEQAKAVTVNKVQRDIEPSGHAGFKNPNSEIIDPASYRPDQDLFYDPRETRRQQAREFEERKKKKERDRSNIEAVSKFERDD